MKKDDTWEAYPDEAMNFQLTDPIQKTFHPIAYVSGETISVSLSLEYDCSNPPSDLLMRGESNQGYSFAEQQLLADAANPNNLIYPATAADKPLPALQVDVFDLIIKWEISTDNGMNWKQLDVSQNKMYVTWQEPLVETYQEGNNGALFGTGFLYLETVYNVSCESAKGNSSAEDIISNVWSKFETRNVARVDGHQLTYYEDDAPDANASSELIRDGDGICYAWCGFFLDALKIQGIGEIFEVLTIEPIPEYSSNPFSPLLLVNNWQFIPDNLGEGLDLLSASGEVTTVIEDRFPYTHIRGWRSNPSGNGYQPGYHEVFDENGLPAQGTSDPISFFNNHALVRIGGKLYDPSYGGHGPYDSLLEYEDQNVAGFEFSLGENSPVLVYMNEVEHDIDFNGDGQKDEHAMVFTQFYLKNISEGCSPKLM